MKLIDITQTYEPGMRRYGSMEDFSFEWLRHYEKGSGMALSKFTMTSHLGTHIDAQFHFLEQGEKTSQIGLDRLCGPARVVDARGRRCVDADFIRSLYPLSPRLLFRTDNTELLARGGAFENVYFTPEACTLMADQGVKLVGIDYFSVDPRGDKSRSAHLPLLERGVVILEALELEGVSAGEYELWCLPLKFRDLEGAPCRAVLRILEDKAI